MLSIERIEGNFALCEDEKQKQYTIPLSSLPKDAAEGDILKPNKIGGYQLDSQESDRRRKAVSDRLTRLGTHSRRDSISMLLAQATQPISASALADKFHVSRQIIVGDIALLRASGAPVVATPRGYLLDRPSNVSSSFDYTVACHHDNNQQLVKELYIVVGQGATILDVIVDHPIYGQLVGQLQISSRFDADRFATALTSSEASPLSQLTGGIHLHTIRCPSHDCFERITAALRGAGILVSE